MVSRGSAEQSALEIKVVTQGRGVHREGKERMLTLAEVQVLRYSNPSHCTYLRQHKH